MQIPLFVLLFLVAMASSVPLPPSISLPHIHAREVRSLTDPIPSSGRQRMLVVTVEYPNQKGIYSGSAWRTNFFDEWIKFLAAQSYNALQFDVDVVTVNSSGNPVINSNVGNYIPLSNNISRYANGQYGWRFNTAWNLHTIVREACGYLDSKNFDWGPYIQENNIVNLLIISAGYDYRFAQMSDVSDPQANFLLATSFSGASYRTRSGAIATTYTFCNEHTQSLDTAPAMAHIGECVHEYGHGLGVPDLYDLSYQTTGVGYFDLMGYGLYGAGALDGSEPIGMGAWVKETLGWSRPQLVSNNSILKLGPSSQAASNVLKIYPSDDSSVYFLVENRQPFDKWDSNFAKQYTNGVIIWKVDPEAAREYTRANHINTYLDESPLVTECPGTPSVILMEADGVQSMSTIGLVLSFGSAKDVWQAGDQFVYNDTIISIVSFDGFTATLQIILDGDISNLLTSSATIPAVFYLSYLSSIILYWCL